MKNKNHAADNRRMDAQVKSHEHVSRIAKSLGCTLQEAQDFLASGGTKLPKSAK